MKVHNVYHKKNPIWSFTVVGRPPQEDTSFGALIHEITGAAIPKEISGLHAVNAVDAAGVHPLLFAIGSERYTPYQRVDRPQEILTIANQILGKNQLSLAKYLFISANEDNPQLDIYDIPAFLGHILERIDLTRDVHFQTNTTIDTLDYSGDGLNTRSKVVFAAAGTKKRELGRELPAGFELPRPFNQAKFVMPGIIAIDGQAFSTYEHEPKIMAEWCRAAAGLAWEGFPLIVLCDDAHFTAATVNNFVWTTFTRSNPAFDIYGIHSFTTFKHWGCKGPLIIDARTKPHHAPALIKDEAVERRVDQLAAKGGSLHGII